MEILPVIKLMEEDLEPLDEENDSASEAGEAEAQAQGERQAQDIKIEEADDLLPEVKKSKPTLQEEDIFVDKQSTPSAKQSVKTKPTKAKQVYDKERKPRKPMTEAQLEHLKRGREKALEVRRAKAQEKKEIADLKAKKKKKEIQQLREEVEEIPRPKKEISKQMSSLETLSPELIKKLQQDAIEGYDKIRKERKAKKKQEQETHNRNTTNMNIINNALNPPKAVKYGDSGFFSHLF